MCVLFRATSLSVFPLYTQAKSPHKVILHTSFVRTEVWEHKIVTQTEVITTAKMLGTS